MELLVSKPGANANARSRGQVRYEYLIVLAKEQTFLASLRVALGLLAAALAVTFAPIPPVGPGTRGALSIALATAGTLTAGRALLHWKRINRSDLDG